MFTRMSTLVDPCPFASSIRGLLPQFAVDISCNHCRLWVLHSRRHRIAACGLWTYPLIDTLSIGSPGQNATLDYRTAPLHSTDVFSVTSRPQRWQCAGVSST